MSAYYKEMALRKTLVLGRQKEQENGENCTVRSFTICTVH
jgi:hypothetical protein